MKKIKNTQKTNFLKRVFIKFCRLVGFEIIDQSSFSSPTLNKDLNETLSVQGEKSITIPLGQINIKNKINSIKIYLNLLEDLLPYILLKGFQSIMALARYG